MTYAVAFVIEFVMWWMPEFARQLVSFLLAWCCWHRWQPSLVMIPMLRPAVDAVHQVGQARLERQCERAPAGGRADCPTSTVAASKGSSLLPSSWTDPKPAEWAMSYRRLSAQLTALRMVCGTSPKPLVSVGCRVHLDRNTDRTSRCASVQRVALRVATTIARQVRPSGRDGLPNLPARLPVSGTGNR